MMGSCFVLPSLPDTMEGVLSDLQFSVSVSIKWKQRGKLPQTLMGNDHNLMLGYAPCYPIDGECPKANQWSAE